MLFLFFTAGIDDHIPSFPALVLPPSASSSGSVCSPNGLVIFGANAICRYVAATKQQPLEASGDSASADEDRYFELEEQSFLSNGTPFSNGNAYLCCCSLYVFLLCCCIE
jgi:glutathione S-transferase